MAKRPLAFDMTRTMLVHRRTKIVATVGPACAAPERLAQLVEAGVDVFRLNFSHGDHASHGAAIDAIRDVAAAAGRHVAILADLCGPKIRVGRFEGGAVTLEVGARTTITTRPVAGTAALIPTEYEALAGDVVPGDRILLDDGRLELRVLSADGADVAVEVVRGGVLSDRKGMNLPGVAVSAPALTDKDRDDALFAAGRGVDFVALSFVRRAQDVRVLRALLDGAGHRLPIIAKIEKPEALGDLPAILEASDGIMVARGDLGVEMPAEQVPLIQQELVRLAIEANSRVIVATQMLETMIESPRPTRAEVSDVATAAMAGADAVMLSGETAAGRHPVEAVQTMDRILRMVEGYQWQEAQFGGLVHHTTRATSEATPRLQLSEALSRAAAQLSRELSVRAIVVPAFTGHTASMVASERPSALICATSADPVVCRRLALAWGVTPRLVDPALLEDLERGAYTLVSSLGLPGVGHFDLLVSGGGLELDGSTATVRLLLTDPSGSQAPETRPGSRGRP